jgi:hypothetical protein
MGKSFQNYSKITIQIANKSRASTSGMAFALPTLPRIKDGQAYYFSRQALHI